jgi:hypothetical protein
LISLEVFFAAFESGVGLLPIDGNGDHLSCMGISGQIRKGG